MGGDPADLQDYEGGRSYSDLETFAKENLKPVCSPKNIDLCDDDKKAEIAKIQAIRRPSWTLPSPRRRRRWRRRNRPSRKRLTNSRRGTRPSARRRTKPSRRSKRRVLA